jgi:hypothetical protein
MLVGCAPSSKRFDSADWKRGDQSTRGAMVQDILDHKYFLGKSRSQINELLGRPDYQDDDWYGYKVVTAIRCHMWVCRMDITFDPKASLVTDVTLSD